MYWEVNNLYGWAIQQKLSTNGFRWIKNLLTFHEDNIKSYNENSNKGYILEVDVEYPKNLQRSHTNLPFLPK